MAVMYPWFSPNTAGRAGYQWGALINTHHLHCRHANPLQGFPRSNEGASQARLLVLPLTIQGMPWEWLLPTHINPILINPVFFLQPSSKQKDSGGPPPSLRNILDKLPKSRVSHGSTT